MIRRITVSAAHKKASVTLLPSLSTRHVAFLGLRSLSTRHCALPTLFCSRFSSRGIAIGISRGSVLCASTCFSNAAVSWPVFLSRTLAKHSACGPVSYFWYPTALTAAEIAILAPGSQYLISIRLPCPTANLIPIQSYAAETAIHHILFSLTARILRRKRAPQSKRHGRKLTCRQLSLITFLIRARFDSIRSPRTACSFDE